MSEMGIDQVWAQMRAMSSMALAGTAPPAQVDNS